MPDLFEYIKISLNDDDITKPFCIKIGNLSFHMNNAEAANLVMKILDAHAHWVADAAIEGGGVVHGKNQCHQF